MQTLLSVPTNASNATAFANWLRSDQVSQLVDERLTVGRQRLQDLLTEHPLTEADVVDLWNATNDLTGGNISPEVDELFDELNLIATSAA